MRGAVEELERATARLLACDGSDLEEMAKAVAERGSAIARLAGEPWAGRECASGAEEMERVRAAAEAGEIVMARVRAWQSGWREELGRAGQAGCWAAGVKGAVERQGRGRIDIAG